MNTDNQLDAVESKLIGALRANYPTGFSDSNTKFPNAPFTTPNDSPWLRPSLVNFGPIWTDASGFYEVNQGVFTVSVFYPRGTGSQNALQTAQHIKGIYNVERFDDVTIEQAVVTPANEPESSNWFCVNVDVTYTFEGYTS